MKVKVVRKKRVEEVLFSTDFIRLDAFLKLANAVGTGGEAKILIQDEQVSVNGEVCLQRGRKLVSGDNVSFGGRRFIAKKDEGLSQ